jgi:dihydroorotase
MARVRESGGGGPVLAAAKRAAARVGAVVSLLGAAACGAGTAGEYDVVVMNGRVFDPESGLDAVRNIGIRAGTIAAVTAEPIRGGTVIDATGLIVAPGFIDLHAHGQDSANYEVRLLDGVTAAFELELGTADVDAWYATREGRVPMHYGVSAGHVPTRMAVFNDAGTRLPVGPAARQPASESEVDEIERRLREGLEQGAVAVGMALQYTPAAGAEEVDRIFGLAAAYGVPVHVHARYIAIRGAHTSVDAVEELLDAAKRSGAALHLAHVHSVGLDETPRILGMIEDARARGLDVTTEVYPYTAGQTSIEGSFFDEGWQERLGVGYGDVQWARTGERLTAESFRRYRREGGLVIVHMIPESALEAALASRYAMIASDGLLQGGRGHPRTSGSYARVLGRYVRERGTLTWMEAIRKMSLLPAQRLEAAVPSMAAKGRIRPGADADIVAFDPERVIDRATYEEPARPSAGVVHVLVSGTPVVLDGNRIEGLYPGRPVRVSRSR